MAPETGTTSASQAGVAGDTVNAANVVGAGSVFGAGNTVSVGDMVNAGTVVSTGSVVNAGEAVNVGDAEKAADKVESPRRASKLLGTSIIDPDGDLFLHTAVPESEKPGTWLYRVCSAALRRQSPVWKTMLYGPWSESKPTNGDDWVVQLPEDHYEAMWIILNILHGKFEKVTGLRTHLLYDIMILTNKYDMTSIIRPWCAEWRAIAWDSKKLTDKKVSTSPSGIVRSLYVAWELGDEELFALNLEDLAMRTRMDRAGLLVYQKRDTLNDIDHLGPQDMLGGFDIVVWTDRSSC